MVAIADATVETGEEKRVRLAAEFAADLRELAEIVEQHPELTESFLGSFIFNVFGGKEKAIAVRRAVGGRWDKDDRIDTLMILRHDMTYGNVRIELNMSRGEACERVVVGTRVIPASVVPAREELVVPESVEEIVEWRCGSLLGGDES